MRRDGHCCTRSTFATCIRAKVLPRQKKSARNAERDTTDAFLPKGGGNWLRMRDRISLAVVHSYLISWKKLFIIASIFVDDESRVFVWYKSNARGTRNFYVDNFKTQRESRQAWRWTLRVEKRDHNCASARSLLVLLKKLVLEYCVSCYIFLKMLSSLEVYRYSF